MGIVFSSFESERFDISQLNVNCSWAFSDQVLTVEPLNNVPALICCCLQALAEALKTNASVTDIKLYNNQIGAEGAKAWCAVGFAELLNTGACHDVMFSTSFDSEKFGRFGGSVVSSFFSDRVELSANNICRC